MRMVPIRQVGPMLGCKDPRTIAARLDQLGVPTVKLTGRWHVNPDRVEEVLAGLQREAPPVALGSVLDRSSWLD